MSTNAHDSVRKSLAAYALGALSPDETAAIDRHLDL